MASSVPGRWFVLDRIRSHAMVSPDAPAVRDGDREVTYRELIDAAEQLADRLREAGVRPGQVVAIATERGSRYIEAALGVWIAGAAYLPLDLAYPQERLRRILSDAVPAAVICSGRGVGLGARFELVELEISNGPSHIGLSIVEPSPSEPGAAAYVIYTSGTSGVAKGVVIGHDSLANLVAWHIRAYEVSSESRALHTAGLGFDAAVWEIWPYLVAGALIVTCPDDVRMVPDYIGEYLVEHQCTHAFVSTPLAEELLRLELPLPALRFLLTGGDKLRLPVAASTAYQLVNHYGPTEATVVTTAHRVRGEAGEQPPIGTPIDNVTVLVCDAELAEVRDGDVGELLIGGAGLAVGYWNAPDATARRFVELPGRDGRWYRSGDLVRWVDGTLAFCGRIDAEQLKVRGVRVEASDIESALMALPSVHAAAVLIEQGAVGDVLVALLVAPSRPSSREVRAEVAARLPAYLVPNRFHFVERLPLTPNGKLDRGSLPGLLSDVGVVGR